MGLDVTVSFGGRFVCGGDQKDKKLILPGTRPDEGKLILFNESVVSGLLNQYPSHISMATQLLGSSVFD